VITLRRVRWVGHAASMEEMIRTCRKYFEYDNEPSGSIKDKELLTS
jgi:hypothetical protein